MTDREKAFDLLEKLRDLGYSDEQILEAILGNYLSGNDALESVQFCIDDFEGN